MKGTHTILKAPPKTEWERLEESKLVETLEVHIALEASTKPVTVRIFIRSLFFREDDGLYYFEGKVGASKYFASGCYSPYEEIGMIELQ